MNLVSGNDYGVVNGSRFLPVDYFSVENGVFTPFKLNPQTMQLDRMFGEIIRKSEYVSNINKELYDSAMVF